MNTSKANPARGKLLISEPALRDFYFSRSVVLLAEHSDEEGSVGLILNKPINLKLKDVVKEFPNNEYPLYLGGPVHPDRLFYLHTLGERIPGSMELIPGLFWGGEIEKLMELVDLNLVSSEEVRFFIGYSGWEPKQLDRELEEDSWIVTQCSLDTVMRDSPERLWSSILKELGDDYAIWANYPADPILN
ncbi:MAG: YqgE/AlgH family protein [Bacteroidales bacterium]|jgi:putative transcriptional regulator|nr:YqgE/AlgH family protein [Bacteroidales bacterium]NLM92995.1 YqgE/AlgH family protein [Bacteroidales bacterium]